MSTEANELSNLTIYESSERVVALQHASLIIGEHGYLRLNLTELIVVQLEARSLCFKIDCVRVDCEGSSEENPLHSVLVGGLFLNKAKSELIT